MQQQREASGWLAVGARAALRRSPRRARRRCGAARAAGGAVSGRPAAPAAAARMAGCSTRGRAACDRRAASRGGFARWSHRRAVSSRLGSRGGACRAAACGSRRARARIRRTARHRVDGLAGGAGRPGGGGDSLSADDVAEALQACVGSDGCVAAAARLRGGGGGSPGPAAPAGGRLLAARRLGWRRRGAAAARISRALAGGFGLDLADRFLERQALAGDLGLVERRHHPRNCATSAVRARS